MGKPIFLLQENGFAIHWRKAFVGRAPNHNSGAFRPSRAGTEAEED
jgi:hypothetical protein